MKKKLLVAAAAVGAALLAGCGILTVEQREAVNNAVIAALENDGQAAAVEKIDDAVAAGKISAALGEKLKAALPLGVAALREAIEKEAL